MYTFVGFITDRYLPGMLPTYLNVRSIVRTLSTSCVDCTVWRINGANPCALAIAFSPHRGME